MQDNVRNCGQYFWLMLKFAEGGPHHCAQLFRYSTLSFQVTLTLLRLGAFEACLQFLTGAQLKDMAHEPVGEPAKPGGLKKWTSSQTREFGDLHALIATLVLSCNTRPQMTCGTPEEKERVPSTAQHLGLPVLQEMPAAVVTLLYGALAPVYIAEAVTACRETGNSIPLIVDMLAQVHNTPAYLLYPCHSYF